ncbi:class I SAM-dependent methyltransferase [Adhaeretor mobilis]|uniref:Ubiquinone/menaquinone biosynthesis C-methyltransferase UbiE n=1 Tax=Adhaeretor mobilis TaxID=1930276 RepID=A0A517MU04_9BACT|nr:class I SAM-dependent methyltransferase [Adhaeretor mobilis]QDS98368.1 Ubiquinone/menaquinone biosynthesis C-methyltransferase UbiE [Adhaeretor mobilis]
MPNALKSSPSKVPRRSRGGKKPRKRSLQKLIENDAIRKLSGDDYRSKVKRVYSGPKGALLSTCSTLSLHIPLGKRIFRNRKFDLRGCRSILDVGSGAGQLAGHVLRYSDPEAELTCTDLSRQMLRRARNRLKDGSPRFVTADLAHLPFRDGAFDCITCGYVLEHLPDPEPGLAEMARVLEKGGRMFLLTTEDNFSGAWTSRLWCCRTYNRAELMRLCEKLNLKWKQELWFTKMHQAIRAGGICVEIEKV